MNRFCRLMLWSWALPMTLASPATAQNQSDSPIYKNYRPQGPSTLIRRSDINYNMLQLFILERKANAGELEAQHELGLRYLLGEGVMADTAKGAHWIGKAADRGYSEAQYNMAIVWFNGWGGEWNPFKTFDLLLTCAEKGMSESQHLLGMFYTENLVVPRNWEEGYRWVKKAADAGYAPSRETLKDFEARGLGVPRDTTKATESTSKPQSRLALGFVFQDGESDTTTTSDKTLLQDALREATPQLRQALGLQKSTEKIDLDSTGLKAIRDAAEEGSPEALAILGRNYERGTTVQKDVVLATVYYLRAIRMSSNRAPALLSQLVQDPMYLEHLKARVESKDPDALYAYATLSALRLDYLLSKTQFPISDQKALEFLQTAVAANHVQARIELGLCYYSGRWVQENRGKAIELWKEAVAMGSKEAQVRIAALTVQDSTADEYSRIAALAVLEKAVQGGSLLAQVALGYCYETGNVVPKRWAEAAKQYRNAAQRGSKDAYAALQSMHDSLRPNLPRFQIAEFQ